MPGLGEQITSDSYQLIKISNQVNYGSYDRNLEKNGIDVKQLQQMENVDLPTAVLNYLSSLNSFEPEVLLFENAISKNAYYQFSHVWTNKDHILTIQNYVKTGSISDLSPYLGPFSNIKTSWDGVATFHLKFDGEVVEFDGYASRNIFSLRIIYWAYFGVYLPPEEYSNEIKSLLLIAHDPNNHFKDRGLYILIPKSD